MKLGDYNYYGNRVKTVCVYLGIGQAIKTRFEGAGDLLDYPVMRPYLDCEIDRIFDYDYEISIHLEKPETKETENTYTSPEIERMKECVCDFLDEFEELGLGGLL